MEFQQIFNTVGLYVAEHFGEGVAIEIYKPSYPAKPFETVARLVQYDDAAKTAKTTSAIELTSRLFSMHFKQVFSISDLFGERKKILFK
jgi:uncharacterized Fe-S radical SAM superfamily protein PflX